VRIVGRKAGEPRRLPPVTAAPLPEAIPDEPCDRCGAPARHLVRVSYRQPPHGTWKRGRLMFCEHHYREHETDLLVCGFVWNI
jgi:hypothetical protein